MPFSVSRVLCLISLTVLVFLSAQGHPVAQKPTGAKHKAPTCCTSAREEIVTKGIKKCVEQKENDTHCKIQAYIFITVDDKKHCMDPTADWVKERVKQLEQSGPKCIPFRRQ